MCICKKNKKESFNKLNETIENYKNDNKIDINAVFGEPFNINNKTIIPICNVIYGELSGGGEYGKVSFLNKDNYPYSTGNVNIVSIKPTGFLVDNNEKIEFIPSTDNSLYINLYNKFIDFAQNILKK